MTLISGLTPYDTPGDLTHYAGGHVLIAVQKQGEGDPSEVILPTMTLRGDLTLYDTDCTGDHLLIERCRSRAGTPPTR